MSARLSVIMPIYDEKYLVAEVLRRVLAVKSPLIRRLDPIVVDDGSRDGSGEILREFAEKHRDRITLVTHDRNRTTTPAWWWKGRVRHKRGIDATELHQVDRISWAMRLVEPVLPWHGFSLVAVARRVD